MPRRPPLPALLLLPAAALVACDRPAPGSAPGAERATPAAEGAPAPVFPRPDRPVAAIVSDQYSDEASRDRAGEAELVIRLAGIRPGMAVADIGAGRGYYTVRLAPVVGERGVVFANDVMAPVVRRLAERAERAGLANVRPVLGAAGNANLPPASTDLALMVHMYHEIADPFGLLWHLHAQLRPGGRVAIVENDRPTQFHGTPPALLHCELAAAGYRPEAFHRLPTGSYLAIFAPRSRPAPDAIRPCAQAD